MESKTIQVTDVSVVILERARQAAVANGVGRNDAAVMRFALHQYVLSLGDPPADVGKPEDADG